MDLMLPSEMKHHPKHFQHLFQYSEDTIKEDVTGE